jgi:glutamate synthase domain-containing protein 3
MTGGVAVVIGPTGRNFAAGMSGGMAFVFDEYQEFPRRCNREMVELERLCEPEDLELVRDLLIQHAGYTGSPVAARLLNDWDWALGRFVKVMPVDYRRVLEARRSAEGNGAAHAHDRDRLEQVEVHRG